MGRPVALSVFATRRWAFRSRLPPFNTQFIACAGLSVPRLFALGADVTEGPSQAYPKELTAW